MTKMVKFVWALCCYFGFAANLLAAQTLSVAVLTTNEQQSEVYRQVFADFEKQSNRYRIQLAFYSDSDFKRLLPNWLESGEHDLLYWQGGERLQTLIQQDVIQPINTLLTKAELQNSIQPAVLNSVSTETGTYALPLSQYGWGFYYNKSKSYRLAPLKIGKSSSPYVSTSKAKGLAPWCKPSKKVGRYWLG